MNQYQREYLEIWIDSFAHFLGWDDKQTRTWAGPLLNRMEPPGMVINEPPNFYVAREMALQQPYYNGLSQRDKWELIRAIQGILNPDERIRGFPHDFDFGTAKRKIKEILNNWADQT